MPSPGNDYLSSNPDNSGKHTKVMTCSLWFTLMLCLAGCGPSPQNRTVVIYTSVDQHYAEPILMAFQKKTGIHVRPVFDVEAAKTTGLINRMIAEKDRPLADVFWSGEHIQTILLKEKGLLAPYDSPSAQGIPSRYRDRDRCWTGFAGRARVLIINTDHISVQDAPRSLFDLLDRALHTIDVDVGNSDLGAVGDEALSQPTADAARSPDDDDVLALQGEKIIWHMHDATAILSLSLSLPRLPRRLLPQRLTMPSICRASSGDTGSMFSSRAMRTDRSTSSALLLANTPRE